MHASSLDLPYSRTPRLTDWLVVVVAIMMREFCAQALVDGRAHPPPNPLNTINPSAMIAQVPAAMCGPVQRWGRRVMQGSS